MKSEFRNIPSTESHLSTGPDRPSITSFNVLLDHGSRPPTSLVNTEWETDSQQVAHCQGTKNPRKTWENIPT